MKKGKREREGRRQKAEGEREKAQSTKQKTGGKRQKGEGKKKSVKIPVACIIVIRVQKKPKA